MKFKSDFLLSRSLYRKITNEENLSVAEKFYSLSVVSCIQNIAEILEAQDDFEKQKYVYVSRENLLALINNKETAGNVMRYLKESKILLVNNSYKVGEYCKSYRVNEEFVDRTQGLARVTAETFLAKHKKTLSCFLARVEANNFSDKEAEWHLRNLKKNIKINRDKLVEVMNEMFNLELVNDYNLKKTLLNLASTSQRMSYYVKTAYRLLELRNSTITKGITSHRHYHILSNCPSALKYSVESRIADKPLLVSIDISNSQPLLLLTLLRKHNYEVEEELACAIEKGKFYEVMNEISYKLDDVTYVKENRSFIKKKVYSSMLFARLNVLKYSKLGEACKEHYNKFYSSLSSFVSTLDKGDTLAPYLQNLEAEIMLPLTKKFKCFGIHDSIVVNASSLDDPVIQEIKDAITDKFNKLGVTVSLGIDIFNDKKEKKGEDAKMKTLEDWKNYEVIIGIVDAAVEDDGMIIKRYSSYKVVNAAELIQTDDFATEECELEFLEYESALHSSTRQIEVLHRLELDNRLKELEFQPLFFYEYNACEGKRLANCTEDELMG